MIRVPLCRILSVLLVVVGAAAPAWAQDAGIGGVVKDATGAVLPGVTVTVTSPVLIEQERTAVTDAEGRFIFTQLRPGVYKVTFALPGFGTVVREGIRCCRRIHRERRRRAPGRRPRRDRHRHRREPGRRRQNVRRQTGRDQRAPRRAADQHQERRLAGDADHRRDRPWRRRRLVPGRARPGRRVRRRRVPWQVGHQGVVRRHGHGEQLRQQQLPAQLRRRSKKW